MKKIIYFILIFTILLSMTGCSKKQSLETGKAPDDMMEAITESQTGLLELRQITSKDEDFAVWLSDYYLIEAEQVEDGTICYADGVEASEIAVLVLGEEKDSKEVQEALKEYIRNRAGVFEGYAPQQAALAQGGIVVSNGRYIALLICEDTAAAKAAFLDCFDENGESEPESQTAKDVYDSAAVLQAWKSGDDSDLSELNWSILSAAKDVIQEEIDNGMSDYEKELAIHDWITGWSNFDYSVLSRSSSEGFRERSDTPYGVLIDRSAMCHGYSSTFQLFMDMLEIECMTVYGTPGSNGVQHSWNMVKLDGEWYCVDTAWDDPIGGSPGHTYFNVTSAKLKRGSIHRWDENAVPEANGTAYAYGRH